MWTLPNDFLMNNNIQLSDFLIRFNFGQCYSNCANPVDTGRKLYVQFTSSVCREAKFIYALAKI